ncbi:TPA: restriction endonuclease subunit S [Streptococcus pneumoniae]|nr:restriction endonuclease subunit S [Streptococcus pneumoniae]
MKKVKLGEVLSLKKGKKATVLAEQTTLSQRYIQIDDLRNNNNLKFTESLNMTEALPDDILIAWDGANAGTVGYGLSGAVGSTITVLKKNERYKEKIISDYLGVFLESKSQYLREHSTGATIPHLNKNILLDLQLELLGIEEQENIICILNTIKRLITKRKLQLDELNLLVKSRFNEMFGDPLNNNKKFAVKTGQQCFKFSSGKFLDKHDRVFEGYPAYGGNGIAWKSRKYLIDNPTIIIGRVGAYCGNVRTTHGKVWISDNAIYIKEFKNSDFNLVFLLELMKVIDFSKFADFSGQPKITQKPLENQKYILPPLALQNEFADFVAQVDKSRFNEMFGENKIFESIDNLFDIIDGDRGKNYPKSDELFSEEYCLFLNTKNVTKNGFSFDTKQFITKTKDKLLRKGKLERYDIVLTTRGTVGNVAYYDELIKYKHLRINSGMVILRPKTPNLNQKFIIHVLRNNNYSRVISGSAQPQLPITKLKKILLPLPPLALQNEFADFVALVDKSGFYK